MVTETAWHISVSVIDRKLVLDCSYKNESPTTDAWCDLVESIDRWAEKHSPYPLNIRISPSPLVLDVGPQNESQENIQRSVDA